MLKGLPNLFKTTLSAVLLMCVNQSANAFFQDNCCPETCAPVQDCCSLPKFEVYAELIYFKPTIDQSAYVISSDSNAIGGEFFPSGKRHLSQADYKPGFRVGALYNLCSGYDVEARFTYFDAGHSSSITGPFLFDTTGFPGEGAQDPEDTFYSGTAHVHHNFKYLAGDLTLNRLSLCSYIDNLELFIGLHYAYIKHKLHQTSVGTRPASSSTIAPVANDLHASSQFWGIGPQLGLDYAYNLTQPGSCYGQFALTANVRGALLASNTHSDLHYSTLRTTTEGVNLTNDSSWRVTPSFDARLGASYALSFWCINAVIEGGYEWLWYNKSVDFIRGIDVAFPGDSNDEFSDLSLQGPYLKIDVRF